MNPWWKKIGPGVVTGAADDDPSGIGTYSIVGAQYGYLLLWLVPFCIPLMIAVQEMCGRVGSVSRQGLAGVMRRHYSGWLLWPVVVLLSLANVINIWADFNIMAASLQMLVGGSVTLWLTVVCAATIALQILVPYRYYVRFLKWLCLALLTYVVTALLPSVHTDWPQVLAHLFRPGWAPTTDCMMIVVGFLGTTISPYLFFWQTSQTVEEKVEAGTAGPGARRGNVANEIRTMRNDTVVGMFASQAVAFFIVICAAATMRGTHIESAQQAAQVLQPIGKIAYWLFTTGILGSGLLAIPTLAGSVAYALAEAAGWREGLYRRFGRARQFYLALAFATIIGYLLNFVGHVKAVDALLYSAVLNGIAAPPLIVTLLLICNNKAIMGQRTNGWVSNLVGGLAAILMAVGAAVYLWGSLAG
ncbi:MAG TPA: divalent metal cation transporter [Candidatus Xenobia bacterium]|jgi:NRAMP (natural resistance-associated macrophage protein)-like metal ion transporter